MIICNLFICYTFWIRISTNDWSILFSHQMIRVHEIIFSWKWGKRKRRINVITISRARLLKRHQRVSFSITHTKRRAFVTFQMLVVNNTEGNVLQLNNFNLQISFNSSIQISSIICMLTLLILITNSVNNSKLLPW